MKLALGVVSGVLLYFALKTPRPMKTDMTVDQIARLCHEANRGLQAVTGEDVSPPWEDAPAWQRESALDGVESLLARPDAPPSASHENWLRHKEADGWTYGPVKNAEKKEHPCMVPYDELPDVQRAKDHVFAAIVRACGLADLEGDPAGLSHATQLVRLCNEMNAGVYSMVGRGGEDGDGAPRLAVVVATEPALADALDRLAEAYDSDRELDGPALLREASMHVRPHDVEGE